eukprot:gene4161-biopygen9902
MLPDPDENWVSAKHLGQHAFQTLSRRDGSSKSWWVYKRTRELVLLGRTLSSVIVELVLLRSVYRSNWSCWRLRAGSVGACVSVELVLLRSVYRSSRFCWGSRIGRSGSAQFDRMSTSRTPRDKERSQRSERARRGVPEHLPSDRLACFRHVPSPLVISSPLRLFASQG